MAKIMSLVYREWVLLRKTLLLALAVTAGMLLMFSFVGFNFQNGAFSGNERMSDMFAKTGGYFEAYLVVFFLISAAESCAAAYESDIKGNWVRYSLTVPADSKSRAIAHALFLLIRILAAFVISLIAGMLITAAYGKSFQAWMAVDFGIYSCISLAAVCIAEFFRSKATDMISYKKQTNCLAGACAALGAVVGLVPAKTMKSAGDGADLLTALAPLIEKYTAFRNAVQLFIIPVFIGLVVLIYVIVKRNLESLKRA